MAGRALVFVVAGVLFGVAGCDLVNNKTGTPDPEDVICKPECVDRECGSDGCGGSCGRCGDGRLCEPSTGKCGDCAPMCDGRVCGDDGCGGTCGRCQEGAVCEAASGTCKVCQPACSGRVCGDDGCGGTCGTCGAGTRCTETGSCIACTPSCGSATCGDDGCGGSCGTCPDGQTCNALKRQCLATCQPFCVNRECGDDRCGGSCGTCPGGQACSDGLCTSTVKDVIEPGDTIVPVDVPHFDLPYTDYRPNDPGCVRDCSNRDCGFDGCGGMCGYCPDGYMCNVGSNYAFCGPYTEDVPRDVCTPNCYERQCGGDGCGGTCGYCESGYRCIEGAGYAFCDYYPGDVIGDVSRDVCAPNCYERQCGNDGCGGTCGYCDYGYHCVEGATYAYCDSYPQDVPRDVCTPSCYYRQCGSDGCGGLCGYCNEGEYCSESGEGNFCLPYVYDVTPDVPRDVPNYDACTPNCGYRDCGDDGCGGQCGYCNDWMVCDSPSGTCVERCEWYYDKPTSWGPSGVISALQTPADLATVQAVCFDYTNDAKGDNGLKGLASQVNGPLSDAIAGGDIGIVLELAGVTNLANTSSFQLNGLLSASTQDPPVLEGDFYVKESSYNTETCRPVIYFAGARISGSKLTTPKSEFRLSIPVQEGLVIDVTLIQAQIKGDIVAGGSLNGFELENGVLSGVLTKETLRAAVDKLKATCAMSPDPKPDFCGYLSVVDSAMALLFDLHQVGDGTFVPKSKENPGDAASVCLNFSLSKAKIVDFYPVAD